MKAKTKILGFLFLLLASLTAMAQGARSFKINEIMVCNTDGFVDEYGQRSAWIEIANTSWGTNDLRGCYLTNDRRTLDQSLSVHDRVSMMSLVPKGDARTNLTAKERLVFFADGQVNRGILHLKFKLVPGKENFVALFDGNAKTLLDSLTVPAGLAPNCSYARVYDAQKDDYVWVVCKPSQVTPDAPNAGDGMSEDKVSEFRQKDPYGFGMSVMGMGIVFSCLLLLYLFFRFFGRFMTYMDRVARFKAVLAMREQARKATNLAKHGMESKGIDREVYAAVIAMALQEYEGEIHDRESDIITIVPKQTNWNMKVGGMAQTLTKH